MRPTNAMKGSEVEGASWEAGKGAAYGALKFGTLAAVLGGVGHGMSPLYRGLTIQFKVYLQMSAMVMGGWVEADSRLRSYEAQLRLKRRQARNRAAWQRFEEDYGKDDEVK